MDDVLTKEEREIVDRAREHGWEEGMVMAGVIDRLSAKVTALQSELARVREENGVLRAQLVGMEGTLRVAMEDEAKLREIVDELPKTKDGVPMTDGMAIFRVRNHTGEVEVAQVEVAYANEDYYSPNSLSHDWWSTKDAARAAHDAKAGKGAES